MPSDPSPRRGAGAPPSVADIVTASTDPAGPGGAGGALADEPGRRVVLVSGARSGTATVAGILRTLGMHVPRPDAAADPTGPAGPAASPWVVDLHEELLRRRGVEADDARPQAWFEAGRLATHERLRGRVQTWLEEQLEAGGPELVLADPPLAWFAGLWRSAALACGAAPLFVRVLQPPPGDGEDVAAAPATHGSGDATHRTAAWLNAALGTERVTRGSRRAFVRQHDLDHDWTVPVFDLGEHLDLHAVRHARPRLIGEVHQLLDRAPAGAPATGAPATGAPSTGVDPDEAPVPPALRDLAEEAWRLLDRLVDPAGDTAETQAALDRIRLAYTELYAGAEALARSTALAARREGAAQAGASAPASTAAPARPLDAAPSAAPAPPDLRGVDRVPHALRAVVPAGARRRLRAALGRRR